MLLSGCHITLILVDLGNLAVSNNLRTQVICCVGRCMKCSGNLFMLKIVCSDWHLIHIILRPEIDFNHFYLVNLAKKKQLTLSILDFRNATNKLQLSCGKKNQSSQFKNPRTRTCLFINLENAMNFQKIILLKIQLVIKFYVYSE